VGHLHQNPGAVAGGFVAAAGPAMGEVFQDFQRVGDHAMGFPAAQMADHAHAAGVSGEAGVVQTPGIPGKLAGEIHGSGAPIGSEWSRVSFGKQRLYHIMKSKEKSIGIDIRHHSDGGIAAGDKRENEDSDNFVGNSETMMTKSFQDRLLRRDPRADRFGIRGNAARSGFILTLTNASFKTDEADGRIRGSPARIESDRLPIRSSPNPRPNPTRGPQEEPWPFNCPNIGFPISTPRRSSERPR
jgi:hypothetical protein